MMAFGLSGVAMSAHAASERIATFEAPSVTVSKSIIDVEKVAQRRISASEAKSIARRKVRGGEVVDLSLNGGTYRVRVIARDGRVVDVYIDAATGRVK